MFFNRHINCSVELMMNTDKRVDRIFLELLAFATIGLGLFDSIDGDELGGLALIIVGSGIMWLVGELDERL